MAPVTQHVTVLSAVPDSASKRWIPLASRRSRCRPDDRALANELANETVRNEAHKTRRTKRAEKAWGVGAGKTRHRAIAETPIDLLIPRGRSPHSVASDHRRLELTRVAHAAQAAC
jgi:hypothetical protein